MRQKQLQEGLTTSRTSFVICETDTYENLSTWYYLLFKTVLILHRLFSFPCWLPGRCQSKAEGQPERSLRNWSRKFCGLRKQSSRAPFCSQRAVEGLASQHLPVDSKVTNHTMTAVCLTASCSLPLPVQLSAAGFKFITQWQKQGAHLIPTARSSPDRLPSVFTLNTYIWSYWLDFEDHFWHDLVKQWYLNAAGSRTCSSTVTQALLKMVLDLEEGMSNLLS